MKIAVACNSFKNDGGMETYTLQLLEGLIPYLDSKPVVITKKFDPNQKLLNQVDLIKINVSWLPRILRDIFFSWKIKRLKAKLNIDLLIGCCRCTESDIVMCGGTHKGFVLSKDKRTIYDKCTERLEEIQNSRALAIVAHSGLMKKELKGLYGVPERKISVMYPPVSLEKFHPVPKCYKDSLRRELGLSPNKFYFLFVSSSHKRKGFDLLSKFFSSTELPVKLLVVGKPIEKEIKNVEYFGYSNEIEKLYQAADFSILASKYEPFGLAAIESVASGTPVVISDKLGSNEVIKESAKYVFRAEDSKSLKSAIENAIQDQEHLDPKEISKSFSRDLSISSHVLEVFQLINLTLLRKNQCQRKE